MHINIILFPRRTLNDVIALVSGRRTLKYDCESLFIRLHKFLLSTDLLLHLPVDCSWLCGVEGCVQAGCNLCYLECSGLVSRRRHLVEGNWVILVDNPTCASVSPHLLSPRVLQFCCCSHFLLMRIQIFSFLLPQDSASSPV
jgi:hypothetical protein